MAQELIVALKSAGAIAKHTLSLIHKRRRERLSEAALLEIADGADPLAAAPDGDQLEIFERFLVASEQGTAVLNLRLMFRILKGLAEHHPQLHANDFAR